MVVFEVGFIGRRMIYEDLRAMLPGVRLMFADDLSSALGKDLAILDYYVNYECVGRCVKLDRDYDRVKVITDVASAIIRLTDPGLVKVGLDYGSEHIGLAIAYDNTPLVGATLSLAEFVAFVRLMKIKVHGIHVGDGFIRSGLTGIFTNLCRLAGYVGIVDETEASQLREIVKERFGLMGDVVDAFSFTLMEPRLVVKCS